MPSNFACRKDERLDLLTPNLAMASSGVVVNKHDILIILSFRLTVLCMDSNLVIKNHRHQKISYFKKFDSFKLNILVTNILIPLLCFKFNLFEFLLHEFEFPLDYSQNQNSRY